MAFRRNHFKFTEKTQSLKGIISLCASTLLLLFFILLVYLAYRSYGGLSMYYGSIGVIAILLSIGSFVLAFMSLREENSFQVIPRFAMAVTIIESICWVGTYILGLR